MQKRGDKMAKRKSDRWLTEEGLIQLEAWARLGLSDVQIAHNMGIHPSTLYEYYQQFQEISEAIKRGKAVADYEVENALYKSARGFEYDEVTYEIDRETGKQVEIKRVTKTMPPSNTAQIFWLCNRKPLEWRQKQQVEVAQEKPFDVNIKVIE